MLRPGEKLSKHPRSLVSKTKFPFKATIRGQDGFLDEVIVWPDWIEYEEEDELA